MSAKNFLGLQEVLNSNVKDATIALAKLERIIAWANLDGTGTASIRDGDGIDGVTDNGAGNYTLTSSTSSLPVGGDYAVALGDVSSSATQPIVWRSALHGSAATGATSKTTSQVRVVYGGTSLTDCAEINVIIIGRRS